MKRVALALVLAAATSRAPSGAGETTALAVAQRANANVSVAASGTTVVAVWSAAAAGGATDIFSAVSTDGGLHFAAPVRVNATPGDARVNAEQPPRVALREQAGRAPAIAIVWTTKGATGTRLLSASSGDGGKTFRAVPVPGGDAAGNRGWEALGVGPQGQFMTVWLDHRRLAASQETAVQGQHHHHDAGAAAAPARTDGVAMAQLSELYVGSLEGGRAPVVVTGGVCYCCKTAIATAGGGLFVAWRHVYPGNMRDIAFSASRDGGRTFGAPIRVSEDKWQIEGCPDDGPSMAVDARGRIHVVWPSVVTERGGPVKALFHAVSVDGRSFAPRTRIPTAGQANHPQLAINGAGQLRVVWDESGSGSRRLASATGTADATGAVRFTRTAGDGEAGTYPIVVAVPGGWLTAWTTGAPDASVVRLARSAS
jgi:hypothetical protein